jgi:hypothetical protein
VRPAMAVRSATAVAGLVYWGPSGPLCCAGGLTLGEKEVR